jgi:hypothetical protein
MARLDTSRTGELRGLANKLRRHAQDMTLPSYIDMMQRAAAELDAEADEMEASRRKRPGGHLDIVV